MRKTEELANPTSCLNEALPDEMVFTLLGRDEAAPETIRHWVQLRVSLGRNRRTDAQIREALLIANTMERERDLAHGLHRWDPNGPGGIWDNPMKCRYCGAQNLEGPDRPALPNHGCPGGKHQLYETGDTDAPDCVKDQNGDVVLGLCRVCRQAECDLEDRCPGKPAQ